MIRQVNDRGIGGRGPIKDAVDYATMSVGFVCNPSLNHVCIV